MTAEELAIQDIMDALGKRSKCLLAFSEKGKPVSDYKATRGTMKPIFKVGDHITHKLDYAGLEEATIERIDDKNYYLKILRGIGVLPIGAQVNYEIDKKWNSI
jgi:hypothetical protein